MDGFYSPGGDTGGEGRTDGCLPISLSPTDVPDRGHPLFMPRWQLQEFQGFPVDLSFFQIVVYFVLRDLTGGTVGTTTWKYKARDRYVGAEVDPA